MKPAEGLAVISRVAPTGRVARSVTIPTMKLSKLALCAALVAAFSLPLTAEAAKGTRKNNRRQSFATLDKEGKGEVSEAQYVAAMKESLGEETAKTQFASMDKNKDGKLTQEEYEAGARGKKGKGKGKKKNQE